MTISPQEKKMLNEALTSLMETSQRSLVSLRKNDHANLALDVEQLAASIATFMVIAGEDLPLGGGF